MSRRDVAVTPGVGPPARRVGAWPTRRPTARAGVDPDPAGRLPVPRRRAAGSSTSARPRTCAPRLSSYFQDIGNLHPRTATMVTTAAERRVDRGQHRGRGAAAGVLLDQGVRPALQREVPRRQVLPVARGHRRRGVPAGDGRPRRQAQGHPLLRPLQPRLGDPRDRRPAAAGLPDALVLQRRLQALRPDRPAVPARLHRQVLGALRRQGRPPRSTARSSTTSATSWPASTDAFVKRIEQEMYAASDGAGLREGRPAARRPRRAAARRWRSRRSCSATAPTPT